uniref:Peptidase S1 domain-containing protein n=1 Tax=Anopheles funestus TaxID=62324 RepID=A0A182RIN5_ANOFN
MMSRYIRLVNTFSLVLAIVCGQELFTDTIPEDYYLRKDLSDCSERFLVQKYYDVQCLIFGGVQVNLTEFPHMAVLGWKEEEVAGNTNGGSVRWQCGGSLITVKYVLTAAHCAADANNIPPQWVRLGDVNLASSIDDEYAQQYEILRIVRHPQHRFSKKYFDLALVELDSTVRLTPGVCPACLWTNSRVLPAEYFQTAGFGATSFGGGPIPNLLKTTLRATNSTECSKSFKNTHGLSQGIADDQVCASMVATDTCQGDSGGPLQVTLRSFLHQHPFVVALTSFGRGCGIGSSGVYQQIAAHISWIESVVNETMDPVRCAEKYSEFRRASSLIPECSLRGLPTSNVRLVWPQGARQTEIPCSGTMIDYNTVVTTASCTKNEDGIQPIEIEIMTQRAKITEIQVHPDFKEYSPHNDLALLRLEKYLRVTEDTAPSCIPLHRGSEVCSDGQTHDSVTCWDKFAEQTKHQLLNRVCNQRKYGSSSVRLIWAVNNTHMPDCVGMVIKPDTVITSIRCMNIHGEQPPIEIEFNELEVVKRIKIVKILKHPGYKEGSRNRDTALLIVAENLENLVPGCISFARLTANRFNAKMVPVYGQYAPQVTVGRLEVPVRNMCRGSRIDAFKEKFGDGAVNSSQYTCWNTEQHIVPGSVPIERGAGMLDEIHRFIHGVVIGSSSFGTVDPVVSINLTAYTDWITRFVLYRPPKVEVVFRGDSDEFDFGSNCTLKNGTAGSCVPDYSCQRAIKEYKNTNDIVICGFDDTISYICCPVGYQDIPTIPMLEIPSSISLLPSLPYENAHVSL